MYVALFSSVSTISLLFRVQEAQLQINKLLEETDSDESLSDSASDSEDENGPTESGMCSCITTPQLCTEAAI